MFAKRTLAVVPVKNSPSVLFAVAIDLMFYSSEIWGHL